MTLEQLRIFIAVAEREHMTEAARALNLTQSATSAAVAALEERHDVKLFDRVGRRILLTDAGRAFLPAARGVLAQAAEAEALLTDLAELRTGRLTLAASQTVGNYWLPPFLHAFRRAHPGIALSLTIANTEIVAQHVLDGVAALGLVEGVVDDPLLIIEPVAEDEMVVIAAPDHPWATQPPGAPAAFFQARWVLREIGSGTRALFEQILVEGGLDPRRVETALELPTNEAVCAAVEAGAGVALLSERAARRGVQAGRWTIIPTDLPQRRFYALSHRQRRQSRAAAAFLALLSRQRSFALTHQS